MSAPVATGPAGAPAIREAQVVAAMQFLSNPKVASSPILRKVQFLESSKGLTAAEICEALKRHSPGSPEHLALEQGIREGKTAVEAVTGMEGATTGTTSAPAATTSSAVPASTPYTPASAAPSYSYAAPPGFVAGPPAFAGGPPTFYPLSAGRAAPPPAPAGSSWKSVMLTAAGVLGGVAAAGAVAHKAFGWELTKRDVNATSVIAASAVPAQEPSTATPAPTQTLAPLPSATLSSTPAFGGADHRLARNADEITASAHDEDDEDVSQRYLSAWLGPDSGRSSLKKRSGGQSPSNDELADEIRALGNKLDLVVEALKENQLELRKLSARSTESAIASHTSSSGSVKMESLLASSVQTQNDMLATLKIMMAAQARATKESAAAAAAAAAGVGSAPAATPPSSSSTYAATLGTDSTTAAQAQSAAQRGWPESSPVSDASISAASSPFGTPSASTPSLSADPVASGLRGLQEALYNLRINNTVEEIRPSCAAMVLYMDNLLNNITSPKYRRVLLSNSSYESRIRRTRGAEKVLLAAGFEINKPYLEWVMPDSTSDTPSLPCGNAAEGTGTGLVMDEAQKTRLLQESLVQLKSFQARLATDLLYDAAALKPTDAADDNAASAPQQAPQSTSSPPPQQQQAPTQQQLISSFTNGTASPFDATQQPQQTAAPAQPAEPASAYQQAWQAQLDQMQQQRQTQHPASMQATQPAPVQPLAPQNDAVPQPDVQTTTFLQQPAPQPAQPQQPHSFFDAPAPVAIDDAQSSPQQQSASSNSYAISTDHLFAAANAVNAAAMPEEPKVQPAPLTA